MATINIDYNLLKTFAKVAEMGSFTKAAQVLSQPKSRVSRSIAKLESELGVELLRRTTRKTSLTAAGQKLHEKVAYHLNCINNELIDISDEQNEMQGTIKVTSSESFAQFSLAKIISDFNEKYPKVKFEMMITNEYVDLVKENIDVAFRAGKLKDSSLIQKKFMPTSFIFVCSKKYIDKYSTPCSIADLAEHKYLSFKPLVKRFEGEGVSLPSIFSSDSLAMLLKMALNGDGVTLLPDIMCQKLIEDKELIRLIPSWRSKSEDVHILYPPTKNQAKRTKEFIEFARKSAN